MSHRHRFRASVTPRLCAYMLLGVAALTGRALTAQSPSRTLGWGLSAGAAVHTGHDNLSGLGPAASAFVRWPTSPRLALTLEALISSFSKNSRITYAPCTPEPGTSACASPPGPLTLGALIAGMRWNDSTVAAGNRGSYLILGGGLYRALSYPTAPGATRLGWTAGFGVLLSRAAPHLALEVRYHQILRWPDYRISVIPVALTLSW